MANIAKVPKAVQRRSKYPITTERAREIYEAAELGKHIRFDNAMEARLYRECYVKTHVGVIDVECQDAVKRLGSG